MITIRGIVVDRLGATPLPFASISAVDNEGNTVGVGTSADSNGIFSLQTDSGYVLVTYTGYQPLLLETGPLSFGNLPAIGLDVSGDLQPVTVTAHKRTNWWPWAIAAAVVYYALK